MSCADWRASLGLSGFHVHPGGGKSSESVVPPAAEGIESFGSGVDRLGRSLVILRLGQLTEELVNTRGKKGLAGRGHLCVFAAASWTWAGTVAVRGFGNCSKMSP